MKLIITFGQVCDHYYVRWVDNIKMDPRKRGWGGMDWTDVARDRDQCRALVNIVVNFRVP
jgi:hypothetical protein